MKMFGGRMGDEKKKKTSKIIAEEDKLKEKGTGKLLWASDFNPMLSGLSAFNKKNTKLTTGFDTGGLQFIDLTKGEDKETNGVGMWELDKIKPNEKVIISMKHSDPIDLTVHDALEKIKAKNIKNDISVVVWGDAPNPTQNEMERIQREIIQKKDELKLQNKLAIIKQRSLKKIR